MTNREFIERAGQLSAEAEHLYSFSKRRKETLGTARERAIKITAEAASADGTIRATVDVGGMLAKLVVAPEALGRELADRITAVVQEAAAKARAAVGEVYAPLRAEGVVRDMPVLLPEPEVPPVPRVVVESDEELSFEDRPSVLGRKRRGTW
jgi:YbaB/EbfC DNA-binding family